MPTTYITMGRNRLTLKEARALLRLLNHAVNDADTMLKLFQHTDGIACFSGHEKLKDAYNKTREEANDRRGTGISTI